MDECGGDAKPDIPVLRKDEERKGAGLPWWPSASVGSGLMVEGKPLVSAAASALRSPSVSAVGPWRTTRSLAARLFGSKYLKAACVAGGFAAGVAWTISTPSPKPTRATLTKGTGSKVNIEPGLTS